jgi:hypothetical protein
MLQPLPSIWQSLIFNSPAACGDWLVDDADSVSTGDTCEIPARMPDMRLLALPQQPTLSVSILHLKEIPYMTF